MSSGIHYSSAEVNTVHKHHLREWKAETWIFKASIFCTEKIKLEIYIFIRAFFVHRFPSLILRKTTRKTVFLLLRNICSVSLLSCIWVDSTLLVFFTFITPTKVGLLPYPLCTGVCFHWPDFIMKLFSWILNHLFLYTCKSHNPYDVECCLGADRVSLWSRHV